MVTAMCPSCPFAAAPAPLLLSAPLQGTAHSVSQEPANTVAPTSSCAMCQLLKFVSRLLAPLRPNAPLEIATCASQAPASTDAQTGIAKSLISFPPAAVLARIQINVLMPAIAAPALKAPAKNPPHLKTALFLPAAAPALLQLNVLMLAIATCASQALASTDAQTVFVIYKTFFSDDRIPAAN